MTLATRSKLSIAPAFNGAISRQQIETVGDGVGITQVTAWSFLHVRGTSAEKLLSGPYSFSQMTIGAIEQVADGILVRLRRDEFLLLTTDLKTAIDHLDPKSVEGLVTLTDITHGRGVIGLFGPRAQDVLPKICALDFSQGKFPDMHAAQAMLANVRALVFRMDSAQLPGYFVIVDRSLTGYVWQIILDAVHEWGGVALNPDSLDRKRI